MARKLRARPWLFASCRQVNLILALAWSAGIGGCGIVERRPESEPSKFDIVGKPMPPDKAKEVLSEIGSNFAYGPGLGDAAVSVGAVVVFPPYALYLLGNAALSLSGYKPVTISSMLPAEDGKVWSETYDTIVSGPGKVAAAVAGREYRSQEVADARLNKLLKEIEEENAESVDEKNTL